MTSYTYIGKERFPLPEEHDVYEAKPEPKAASKRKGKTPRMEVSITETSDEAPSDGATDASSDAGAE